MNIDHISPYKTFGSDLQFVALPTYNMAWGRGGRSSGGASRGKSFRKGASNAKASAVTQVLRKAPTASTQKSQIVSLSKRVTALKKVVDPMVAHVTWKTHAGAGGAIPIIGGGSIPYDMGTPSVWTRLFTDTAVVNAGAGVQKAQVTSYKVFATVECTQDTKRDWITFVCFSLKKIAKTRWPLGRIDVASGDQMGNGEDYAQVGEQVKLNPNLYKVHYTKSFDMGWWETVANENDALNNKVWTNRTSEDLTRHLQFNISHNKKYTNTHGDAWDDMIVTEIPIENHVYVMAFSGNLDQTAPTKTMRVHAIITTDSADR